MNALLATVELPVKWPSVCVTQTFVNTEALARMGWMVLPVFAVQGTQVHSVKLILMSAFLILVTMEQCAGMESMDTPASVSQATKASIVT